MSRSLLNVLRTSHFLEFAFDECSQGGEDGILTELFRRLSIQKGSLVDIGAWDGKHLSNSRRLLHHEGWRGLLVEANESRSRDCAAMYAEEGRDVEKEVVVKNALVNFEKGDEASVCSLIESVAFLNYDFELLNIDVDGNDYHLMEHYLDSFSHQRCKVIVCEFNPSIPNEVYFVQARDMNIQQGSSLRSITQLAVKYGYMLVCTTIFNAIYVRQDLVEKVIPADHYPSEFYDMLSTARDNAQDASKEVKADESALTRVLHLMNKGDMTTSFFQTYDGEIKLIGCKRLLWHDMPINVQKFQVLKKKERRFPFGVEGVEGKRVLETNIRSALSQLSTILVSNDDGSRTDAVELVRGLLVHITEMLKYACTEHRGLSLIYCLCYTESLHRVHEEYFPELIAIVENHADAKIDLGNDSNEADSGEHHGAVFWMSIVEHMKSFQESVRVTLLRGGQESVALTTNGTNITQMCITAGVCSAADGVGDVSEPVKVQLWVKLARAHRLQGNLLGASFYLKLCFVSQQPSEVACKELFKLYAKIKDLHW